LDIKPPFIILYYNTYHFWEIFLKISINPFFFPNLTINLVVNGFLIYSGTFYYSFLLVYIFVCPILLLYRLSKIIWSLHFNKNINIKTHTTCCRKSILSSP
jgi:hypothetical protein